tara:strand:- start:664 stop:957 length:294 start_codon:yes stop_codon:yes gene_type:complete
MQNKLEIALGVVIWDVIQEHIDNVPETQDLDDLTREKLYGDSVNNMALILSENLREECKDMIDDIKRENYWGSYSLEENDTVMNLYRDVGMSPRDFY